MINFFYETPFELPQSESLFRLWVEHIIRSEGKEASEVNYIFCDDAYLLELNQKYLNHDTYTDIITFDQSQGQTLQGDIYISTQRVSENAQTYKVPPLEELLRVMAHGILHMCGYGDKSPEESQLMRQKEEEKMQLFNPLSAQ